MTASSNLHGLPAVVRALSSGFQRAGVRLVTNHPGFYSHSLAESVHGDQTLTSANEKIAYAVAWGAAAAGWRTVVALKNVGMNDAADPFLNSLMLNLTGALVVVVFDDTDVEQSQLRLDSRHYQSALGGIWLEPSNVEESAELAFQAVQLSEKYSSPVVVRITNSLIVSEEAFDEENPHPQLPPPPDFDRRPSSFVVHPSNYHLVQASSLAIKQAAWNEWAEQELVACASSPEPDDTGTIHIMVGSATYPSSIPSSAVLRLKMLPVPVRRVLELAGEAVRMVVYEHGDPIVANILRASCGAAKQIDAVAVGNPNPNRVFRSTLEIAPLLKMLRELPLPLLIGDVGGHTMDPSHSIDLCLCYGSAVAVGTGVALACPEHTVSCVLGDGAWMHGGKTSIDEAVARKCRLLVFVLHNGGCASTGGQATLGDLACRNKEIFEIFTESIAVFVRDWSKELNLQVSKSGVKVFHINLLSPESLNPSTHHSHVNLV